MGDASELVRHGVEGVVDILIVTMADFIAIQEHFKVTKVWKSVFMMNLKPAHFMLSLALY